MLMWENWLKHSQNKKTKGQTMSVWYLVSCKTELLLVSYYLCKYMVFSPYLHVRLYSYMKKHLSSKLRLEPQDTCLWIYMVIRIWSSSFTGVGQYLHSHFMLSAKNKVYSTDRNPTCSSWSWSTLTIQPDFPLSSFLVCRSWTQGSPPSQNKHLPQGDPWLWLR